MEDLLRLWFDTSQQGGAILEPLRNNQQEIIDFRYCLVNSALAQIHGRTQDELTGKSMSQVFSPDRAALYLQRLLAIIQATDPSPSHQHYMQEDEGLWLHITLSRMGNNGRVILNVRELTEQKKTELELQRRLAMESIISTVSGRLIALDGGEMGAYIDEALGLIGNHIGAERASVFRYSDDLQHGSCVQEWCAAGINSRKDQLQNIPLSAFSWIYQQLNKGQVIRLDANEMPPGAVQEKAILESITIYSMIAVPMIQEGKTLGFIGFYAMSKPQQWDQNDVSLLETFSTLIVNAQDRLCKETTIRRTNQRLQGLHAIDRALLSPRSTNQSPFLMALRHLNAMVPCEQLTVYRIDKATNLATALCQLTQGVLETDTNLAISAQYVYAQVQIDHQERYIPDLQPDTVDIPPERNLYDQGYRSLIIIPLYDREECIGAFSLASFNPHFFSDEHRQIAQEVARQLAIVLHQQELDRQLKQYTEQLEQRVEERTQEIKWLSTLHQAILTHAGQTIVSTDINGIIQTANQASEKLLGYRMDELIGRFAHLEPGPPENPTPILSYQSFVPIAPPSDFFLSELTSRGYYSGECIAIGKDGRRIPILMATSVLQDENGVGIGYMGIATDITALKTAETKLQQKNHELNTFFEVALDLNCIADADGNFIKVNQAWETALGYPETELTRLTFGDLVHPEERPFVLDSLQMVMPSKPVHSLTNRFQKKDGTYRIVEWNAILIDKRIYVSARDLTERQESENQLRSLNQRLELATQAAGQGIWENDLIKDVLIWDDRLWQLYGVEPRQEEWSVQKFLSVIHPDDMPVFLEDMQRGRATNKLTNVTRILHPDGAIRFIETNGLVVLDEQGRPARTVGVAWDITERKLAEEALRESEQRFREIADNVDEVFWIHSADTFQLLYINSAYERVFGISPDDDLTSEYSFLDTILDEDRPRVLAEFQKYQQGQEVTVQCRMQGTHPTVRWLQIRTFIMNDCQGVPLRYIGIASDITSQKEKELVLQQSLEREQELNQLKSQFVSTASHEFRTPLTTIQSSVDLLKLYLDLPTANAKQSIQKHLGVIEKEIEKFSELLMDMLTIGRIEAGKVTINARLEDIVDICTRVIATHFSDRKDHRTVQVQLEGTPYQAFVDTKLISHVLVNLLSNAFKFSKNSPCLRILFKADQLVIQVVDEGIGIPRKDLGALFQTFYRASNTAGIPGTGLGLVIARQFVELHNGYLDVQSEENKGTTFSVTLPIAQNDQVLPALVLEQKFNSNSL